MSIRLGRTPSGGGNRDRGRTACPYGFRLLRLPTSQTGLDEGPEQRVRLGRLRFELRMALHRHKPGMVPQLHDLNQVAVRAGAGNQEAMLGELIPVLVIELITVAVPLMDLQ